MKKRYLLLLLLVFLTVSTLVACASQVRIADAPLLLPDNAATTAVPAVTAPAGQTADPAATSPAATSPGTGETLPLPTERRHHEGLPRIILESDEIVPVPNTLLSDLNKTLDELLESIGRLESPDEDVLIAP